MSNSYTRWSQPNQGAQLEHEFDFTAGQAQQPQFADGLQYQQPYDNQAYYPSGRAAQTGYSNNAMYTDPALYNPNTASQSSAHLNQALSYQDVQPAYGYQQHPFADGPRHTSAPLPNFVSSPGSMQQSFSPPVQSPALPATRSSSAAPAVKRARPSETEDNQDGEDVPESKSEVKVKPQGACARCKHLKVRCEFKTETEPCRRCLNGGHECAPPGQKKRRTPPKREHLLNQIREQAAQIQELMSQLEATNKAKPQTGTLIPTSFTSSDLHSPVLSPNSTDTQSSYVISSPTPGQNFNRSADNKAVEDWISKARESLAQFGGLIGAANGMPKSYFVNEDSDDEENSSDEDIFSGEEEDWEAARRAGESGEYAFAVADSDGEEVIPRARGTASQSKHTSRSSSVTGGPSAVIPPKKKDSNGGKLVSLPTEDSPFGLMADLSLKKLRQRGNSGDKKGDNEEDTAVGVASKNFFRTSPAPESASERTLAFSNEAPYILARGIITPAEAETLFELYYTRMNLSASLLDPVLYTAEKTCIRSPFLFTVVCAIASRFYTQRPELYAQAMHYAQLAAGSALIGGQKSVEMCQGYILLSLFPVPARRWEDDRSWLYVGLAIRVAVDLNLHLPSTATPTSEAHAREMLNRTRVWLNCFNLDRSTSSEYGKFPIIKNTDYLANHSENWWCSSPYNMASFDIHICAYTAELTRMTQFREVCHNDPSHPTGRNKTINLAQIATETDDDLCQLRDVWLSRVGTIDIRLDPQNAFRSSLLKLAYGYARLIALSTGFQYATLDKSDSQEANPFLERCLRAATDIVNAVLTVEPVFLMYLQHGPVAQTVFVVFSATFLVKLLQPKYAPYLSRERRIEIRGLVERVVELLEQVGLDDTHAPRLYARFLRGLLATPMTRVDHPSPNSLKNMLPRQKRTKRTKPDRTISGEQAQVDYASPASTSSSMSPPSTAYTYFDDFSVPAESTANMNEEPLNLSSPFFNPPLGLDVQILQSMASLTDRTEWDNISSAPALSWMNHYQPDVHMEPSNATYNNHQYFYQ